jgi:SAM-dependent methyltransferase
VQRHNFDFATAGTDVSSWQHRLVQRLPGPLQRLVERYRLTALVLIKLWGEHPRTCPICGYRGKFYAFGLPPSFDAMCRGCESLERHRLLAQIDVKHRIFDGVTSMLHFAPERILESKFRLRFKGYRSADLFRADVDYCCNIEDTKLPSTSFDAILASHVLEHVEDDRRAMRELYRLLKPGGKLIAMIPIVEGWDETYENPAIKSESDRWAHFGQKDHVRIYGADFVDRLRSAGFTVTAYTGSPQDCVTYGLARGEKVFVAVKQA